MNLFIALLYCAILLLTACTRNQPETRKLDMTQLTFATQEELASKRVDYTAAEVKFIQRILAAACRVLSYQSTLEEETPVLGKGHYYVPKLSSEEIRSVGFDKGSLTRFPAENDWDSPAVFKGFIYGFRRDTTRAPWTNFGIDSEGPYEYTVSIPVTRDFLDTLGLVLIKTAPDHHCDNAKGKCHAFFYKSNIYPTLGFVFLTDPDRSDLKSGLPTNFRSVDIDVINPVTL